MGNSRSATERVHDEQIRERLRLLAKERSQSDLARKTNTLVSTVNRYLKSTKIPAEFCAAVINGLGVNPAWLMAGEGTPYLADVSAGTSEMASSLLELVDAMNQVARMKLGALTGKDHLKVLRELNDALERYESLRAVLNRRTHSVFRELLDSFRKALHDMDQARAAEIRKAATQVSRLSDDPELNVEFDGLQEFYEHVFGDQVRALELSRRVFVKSLAVSDVTMDKDHLALAINLVASLHRADRAREARRICRAALALYEDVGSEWGRYRQLRALHAILNIELGNLRDGLRDLHDTYPVLPPQLKRSFSGKLVETLLLSDLTPLKYATAIGEDSQSKAAALVRVAGLLGDFEYIRELLNSELGAELEGSIWRAWARGLIAADTVDGFESAIEAERGRVAVRPAQEFAYRVAATRLALVCDKPKVARKAFEDAQEQLDGLDPAVSPQMLALAQHHANALELYPPGSKAKGSESLRIMAQAFFREYFDRGYGAYARFLGSE
jgi:transcriptional regulator with XRE-family HTH domain